MILIGNKICALEIAYVLLQSSALGACHWRSPLIKDFFSHWSHTSLEFVDHETRQKITDGATTISETGGFRAEEHGNVWNGVGKKIRIALMNEAS